MNPRLLLAFAAALALTACGKEPTPKPPLPSKPAATPAVSPPAAPAPQQAAVQAPACVPRPAVVCPPAKASAGPVRKVAARHGKRHRDAVHARRHRAEERAYAYGYRHSRAEAYREEYRETESYSESYREDGYGREHHHRVQLHEAAGRDEYGYLTWPGKVPAAPPY